MSDSLVIEVNEDATAVVAATAFEADGSSRAVPPDALDNIEPTQKVSVVLDGRSVAAYAIELPDVDDAKARKILPAVFDEKIAALDEACHLSLFGARHAETGTRTVGVVARRVMDNVSNLMADHGLKADLVLPDYMLLETPHGHPVQLTQNSRCLVRMPDGSGYALEADAAAFLAGDLAPRTATEQSWIELIRPLSDGSVNMLQGDFAPRTSLRVSLLWWRRAAVLALLALLIAGGNSWYGAHENFRLAERYYEGAEDVFREALPNEPRIVNMEAQLRRALAGRRQQGGSEFFVLASFVMDAIEESEQTLLETLRYDHTNGEVSLDVSFATFADSTEFKRSLERAGMRVSEGSSRQESGRVYTEIRLGRQ